MRKTDPIVLFRSESKGEIMKSELKCPHCGNEDLEQMRYAEWISSHHRRIRGFNQAGTLFIANEYSDKGEAAKSAHVFCETCCEEFPLPIEMGLEFADCIIEDPKL